MNTTGNEQPAEDRERDAAAPDAAPEAEQAAPTAAADAEEKRLAIGRSTTMMSMLTLLSRLTGFIRTWAMAFALGNTVLAASFSLANNLPNMIYEFVAGGVLSTAFLPIYVQQRNQRSEEAASAYASNLLSIAIVALGLISLAASVFAPQVMVTQSLFSSASDATVEQASWFFRFFSFEIVFYGISAVFGGLLNARRQFFWPAISSVFMNAIIIVTFFGYPFVAEADPELALWWLALGVTLSIAAMAFVQLPALLRSGFRFRFGIDLGGEGLRETLRLALPAIACTAINLVALSFMNSCALNVAENGPSSVSYAWMWYQFPYGVVGVALSTALFTEMSDSLSRGDGGEFKRQLKFGLESTWQLIIPMAVFVYTLAFSLIGLYTAGEFTTEDIRPIATLLRGWAIVLPLYAGYMFLYRAFSSMKDLKTIAVCNLFLTVVQVGLYMVFTGVVYPGGHDLSIGLMGLAVGDFVFYALMMVILLAILRHRVGAFHLASVVGVALRVSLASAGGFFLADQAVGLIGLGTTGLVILDCIVEIVVYGGFGFLFTIILCRILGVDALGDFIAKLARRMRGH